MSESQDLKMRVADADGIGGSGDPERSAGPSTTSAPHSTAYNRKLADRQYNRNLRFARQFREFATGKTPRSPIQVRVDRYSDSGDGVREKLLSDDVAQDADQIAASGRGGAREPGHLARFLNRSQAHRRLETLQQKRRRIRLIVLVALPVSLVFAAAAVAWHDSVTPGYNMLGGLPLVAWLLLAADVIPSVIAARLLMAFLVRLLESAAVAAGLNNVHYVLLGVTDALKCARAASAYCHYSGLFVATPP